MDNSIVAPNNSKVLTVTLRREPSRVSYSTDNRSILKPHKTGDYQKIQVYFLFRFFFQKKK